MHGVDLRKLTSEDPARAWNVIYAMLIDNMDDKHRKKFESDLFRKPVGVTRHSGGDAVDHSLMAGAAAYLKSLPPPSPAIDS